MKIDQIKVILNNIEISTHSVDNRNGYINTNIIFLYREEIYNAYRDYTYHQMMCKRKKKSHFE